MAKKVVAINYGYIHYHAGCNGGCDFTDAIGTGRNSVAVRRAVLKHVKQTGHECWIEAGKHTSYRLEAVEHRVQATGLWDCKNCENRQIGAGFDVCPNCDTPRR